MNGRGVAILVAVAAGLLLAAGGVAWAQVIECDRGLCEGTSEADTMTGNERKNTISGRSGNDTIRGLGDNDHLMGKAGDDRLMGGRAGDLLYPGPGGDDILEGGGNADAYRVGIRHKWGSDRIVDTPFGEGNNGSDPPGWFSANSLEFLGRGYVTPGLDAHGVSVDLNSGPGAEARREGGGTIDWKDDAIDHVELESPADDTVVGNDRDNRLDSVDGTDTVSGGEGDDRIGVRDTAMLNGAEYHGDDAPDTVDCGPGDDIAYVNSNDTVANCETLVGNNEP